MYPEAKVTLFRNTNNAAGLARPGAHHYSGWPTIPRTLYSRRREYNNVQQCVALNK